MECTLCLKLYIRHIGVFCIVYLILHCLHLQQSHISYIAVCNTNSAETTPSAVWLLKGLPDLGSSDLSLLEGLINNGWKIGLKRLLDNSSREEEAMRAASSTRA